MPLVTIKAGFGEHSEPGADGQRVRYEAGDPPFEISAETYGVLKRKFDLAPGEPEPVLEGKVAETETSLAESGSPPFDVAAHSVPEVMAAVDAGVITAEAALSAEMAREAPRTSLIDKIEKLIEEAGDDASE